MAKYSRDELISIAKYAEQAERYDDMQEVEIDRYNNGWIDRFAVE